jgi:hypothetical protein
MITVHVLNGTPTSAGNGPGIATLPDDEALRLLHEGLATRGDQPHFSTGIGPSPVRMPP